MPTTLCIIALLTLPPLIVLMKLYRCELSKVTKGTERYPNSALHSYTQASLMHPVCVAREGGRWRKVTIRSGVPRPQNTLPHCLVCP